MTKALSDRDVACNAGEFSPRFSPGQHAKTGLFGPRDRQGDAMFFNGAISRDGRTMLITRGVGARDAFLMTKFR